MDIRTFDSNLADLGSSTGHNVRYVLAFGLGGIAFLIIGLYFYGVQFQFHRSHCDWKQNMVVLMTLYPVVMLITAWIEHPFLVGTLKMSHWSALFIDNTISVLVLSVLTPWASRRLDWWLRPADSDRKRDIAGVALSVLLIAAYSRPFAGKISVTPELLKQVTATEAKGDITR